MKNASYKWDPAYAEADLAATLAYFTYFLRYLCIADLEPTSGPARRYYSKRNVEAATSIHRLAVS